jgi:hypothetical protein
VLDSENSGVVNVVSRIAACDVVESDGIGAQRLRPLWELKMIGRAEVVD